MSKEGATKATTVDKEEEEEATVWNDALQAAYTLIRSVGEECIAESELKALLVQKEHFFLYDGFEPSGRMHIAQGVFKAVNVNKCTAKNRGTFVFWVADWFALMNDKMGGDLEKIKVVGHYLIEVWKAAGMNLDNVLFKWASFEITQNAETYWTLMLNVAKTFNITRIKKCCQIMGRLEGNLTAAQILYPLMQATDVFFLRTDICQLGVDQRKVNMLAREYAQAAKRRKPIILSHHMLYGLKAGQEKMSKSDPDSAIFMEDTAADVERKIRHAYCPSRATVHTNNHAASDQIDAGTESMHLIQDDLKNPILDYIEHIILSKPNSTIDIDGQTFDDFATVKSQFLDGTISEESLKTGLIEALNLLLEPVREHFTNDPKAKELLETVRMYKREKQVLNKTVRRLNLVEQGTIVPNAHLVLAPLPNAKPSLQTAMDIIYALKQCGDEQQRVLYLPDWCAIVTNSNSGDQKAIAAFYTILLTSLKALAPDLDFTVLFQSQAILSDPSNYWISVINVGRHFSLEAVAGSLKDTECVGHVIARLMFVADVMGVEPQSLCLDHTDVQHGLVQEFLELNGLLVPTFVTCRCDSIRLQPERESEALVTDNDEYLLTDDPKVAGKSKLNKSFAQEGNVDFCPALSLAKVFCFDANQPLFIKRSDANGGDITYDSHEKLIQDYKSGALHPGDLKKNGVGAVMVEVLEKLSTAIKADKSTLQATKTLKQLLKKKKK